MNGGFTHTRQSRGKSLFVQIVGQLNGHRVEVARWWIYFREKLGEGKFSMKENWLVRMRETVESAKEVLIFRSQKCVLLFGKKFVGYLNDAGLFLLDF